MGECICNSCKNLKAVVNEENNDLEYKCEFGFPSTDCEECNEENCVVSCENYTLDTEDEEYIVTNCKGCGKELKTSYNDGSHADVFCFDCYISSKG